MTTNRRTLMKRQPGRITIITETYAPEINGVAHTLSKLVEGMLARGLQVQLVRPRQKDERSNRNEQDIQLVTLPGLPIPGYQALRFGLPLTARIRRELKRFQPDAVYVATEGPLGWASVKVARKLNIPVYSGFHTNFHQYIEHYRMASLGKLAFRYLRYFHNMTAGTLVPTRIQQQQLSDSGIDHVEVLARGVDSQCFSPDWRSKTLRQQWHARDNDIVLLYVGRVAGEKNLDLAIRTWKACQSVDDRIRLVIVGDGPERHAIQQHYPDVICCGMQRGQELAAHYASGDIFLFPSKTDTFGNVVTEAMASGLAVVSFDYAAAHEHIEHGESGLLAPFADDNSFIRHATTLCDSPNLLRQIRSSAREHALGVSWDNIVDQFIQRLGGKERKVTDYGHGKNNKNGATV